MSFLGLVFKNLFRQPVRTGLTVLGISIGITTVVALGVVTQSLKASAGELIKLGGADFMVAQKGAADLSFSIVDEEEVAAIAEDPEVDRVEGVLFHIARVGSNPFFFLGGREASALEAHPPNLVSGVVWSPDATDEIILGKRAADDSGLVVGDTIEIDNISFHVVGIYKTGILYEDGGGYAPLATVQEIAGKTGVVTAAFVTVVPGAVPEDVADRIENEFPDLATIANTDEYGKVDQGVQMLDAANLAISVLAVGIGAIGVMNTMAMSVFERTREIGVLRAVGWSGRRILRLIMGESIFLCVVSAVVGSLLGVLATRAILMIDTINNLLVPQYDVNVFLRAFAVAIGVALAGAAYPAWRAVRLVPMEALRYE